MDGIVEPCPMQHENDKRNFISCSVTQICSKIFPSHHFCIVTLIRGNDMPITGYLISAPLMHQCLSRNMFWNPTPSDICLCTRWYGWGWWATTATHLMLIKLWLHWLMPWKTAKNTRPKDMLISYSSLDYRTAASTANTPQKPKDVKMMCKMYSKLKKFSFIICFLA